MGLGKFTGGKSKHEKRAYPDHERQDEIEEWVDEIKTHFPDDNQPEIEFIEVSTQMSTNWGKAFHVRTDGTCYIRLAEGMMKTEPDGYIKAIIAHELCHVWLYQNGGSDITEKDPIFSYVLGAVGAHVSGYYFTDEKMEKFCSPFSDYF